MNTALRLGVNIDHVATLRQARYRGDDPTGAIPEPDPVWAAVQVELAGAHGITVHLREDRRHMQDRDIHLLRQTIRTNLNLELTDVPEIVAFAEEIKPDEACLVPEKRTAVTTKGGLNVRGAMGSLRKTIKRLHKAGIAVSLFIDAETDPIKPVPISVRISSSFTRVVTPTPVARQRRNGNCTV